MTSYDDGEAFADDDPADLVYLVIPDRFAGDLLEQIRPYARDRFSAPQVAGELAAVFRPPDRVTVDKRAAHTAAQLILDRLAGDVRTVVAHEALTLAQQHTDAALGRR